MFAAWTKRLEDWGLCFAMPMVALKRKAHAVRLKKGKEDHSPLIEVLELQS